MTHIIIHMEEWEEEICDNCGHPVSMHYDIAQDVASYETNEYMYTAEGCMALSGTRKLNGNNPYLRCNCLHSV